MNVVMNGYIIAWLYGSRNGTYGKIHKLQMQNPKERSTTALLKTQYPMPPLPCSITFYKYINPRFLFLHSQPVDTICFYKQFASCDPSPDQVQANKFL